MRAIAEFIKNNIILVLVVGTLFTTGVVTTASIATDIRKEKTLVKVEKTTSLEEETTYKTNELNETDKTTTKNTITNNDNTDTTKENETTTLNAIIKENENKTEQTTSKGNIKESTVAKNETTTKENTTSTEQATTKSTEQTTTKKTEQATTKSTEQTTTKKTEQATTKAPEPTTVAKIQVPYHEFPNEKTVANPTNEQIMASLKFQNLYTGQLYEGNNIYNMTWHCTIVDPIGKSTHGLVEVSNPYNVTYSYSGLCGTYDFGKYEVGGYTYRINYQGAYIGEIKIKNSTREWTNLQLVKEQDKIEWYTVWH